MKTRQTMNKESRTPIKLSTKYFAVVGSLLLWTLHAQAGDGADYSVLAYNDAGSAESQIATVVVRAPALPFNDYFANAGKITSASGIGSSDNSNATRESGEPLHDGKPGGHSLWLRWV